MMLGTGITSISATHGREPILDGTATTVRAVVENWKHGIPIEQISERLPHLDLAQVLEAIYFYLQNSTQIDLAIAANRTPDEWLGRRFDPSADRSEP